MNRSSMALLACLLGCSGDATDPKYSREECIVKVDLEWLVEDSFDRAQARNALGHALVDHFDSLEHPLGGMAISDNGEEWFFQFRQRCEAKTEMADEAFQSNQVLLLRTTFEYSISTDAVTPGVETISLRGKSWRD